MKIKGRLLLFDTIDNSRSEKVSFQYVGDIKYPEKVPLVYKFNRTNVCGYGSIERDEKGLYVKGNVLDHFDYMKTLIEQKELYFGGYYTNINMVKQDEVSIIKKARLQCVSIVLNPANKAYLIELDE